MNAAVTCVVYIYINFDTFFTGFISNIYGVILFLYSGNETSTNMAYLIFLVFISKPTPLLSSSRVYLHRSQTDVPH